MLLTGHSFGAGFGYVIENFVSQILMSSQFVFSTFLFVSVTANFINRFATQVNSQLLLNRLADNRSMLFLLCYDRCLVDRHFIDFHLLFLI